MKQATIKEDSECPCGGVPKAATYANCCGRYHAGALHLCAPTPEALMRSRYSAYALGLSEYINATWSDATRPASLQRFDAPEQWLGLDIRNASVVTSDEGFVEFVARSKPKGGGAAQRLHEVSRFVREDARWRYIDGTFPTKKS
jgi:SEC-C motif domain protein